VTEEGYLVLVAKGAVAGYIVSTLQLPPSPGTTITRDIIGIIIAVLSIITADRVSLLGKTWWVKALLWVITIVIIVSVLIPLLLPSVKFNYMNFNFGYIFSYVLGWCSTKFIRRYINVR
jgi:hypothetical protein